MRTRRPTELSFFCKVLGMVFVAIFVVSLMREMLISSTNQGRLQERTQYRTLHLTPNTGSSRPIQSPHLERVEAVREPVQFAKAEKSQEEKIKKYMYVDASKLRGYDGIITLKAGETVLLLVLPDTGYHTLTIHGDDITAGLRESTSVQFSFNDGSEGKSEGKSKVGYESKYTWNFVDKIDLVFYDVFARAGTSISAKYIAPVGYITYIGLNITARMRTNILPVWVYGM